MSNIHFEVTNDPKYLSEYYKIREECFRTELFLDVFDGSEDQYDKEGYILIARDGNRCIGGARINGCTSATRTSLPIENENFNVKDYFPELSLDNNSYCQWTRLAILPEYRSMEIGREFALRLPRVSAELGFKYAFNVSGMTRARLYRRTLVSAGIDYKICNHVVIPAETGFQDLEHLLSIAFLQESPLQSQCFNHHIVDGAKFSEPVRMAA